MPDPSSANHTENVFIPMPDGTRLAARIWLPEGAEAKPVPAILEYLPYRKRDGTRARDALNHPWFAANGYACVRVDMRGSGDSEGVLEDEYLQQEQDDGLAVLAWIGRQPWCTGDVGMIGISWGGFNGLQLAALRPPELKAVITLCSTDDRYADDVHYMGGTLLGDNLSWASTMFAYNSRSPDPEVVGEGWREMWRDRLEGSGLWVEKWLRHQHRDAYWKHGSVCEDLSAIEVPVLAVGGWADAYSNAIFRLLGGLDVPRQGLIGPWAHAYPHIASPGPAIGFLQEALRWWDRWLKGADNDVMDEPMLRAWMQHAAPPATGYEVRPGRWVGEPTWPSPNVAERRHPLAGGRLNDPDAAAPQEDAPLAIRSPLDVGAASGKWCAFGSGTDLPGDQRIDDAGSLVFDGPVLEEDVEILGAPVVELELSSDQPVAMVAARLCDVLPDGRVTRVTYGLLNLTQREDREHPEPLEPGRRYRVRVRMNEIAQRFEKGHRIRLALSTSYWPHAWLPPEATTLTVHPAASALTLPVRPPRAEDDALRVASEPVSAEPLAVTELAPGEEAWRHVRDAATGASRLEIVEDKGRKRIDEIDLEIATRAEERYEVRGEDVDSARAETVWEIELARGAWRTRTVTRTVMTSTPTHFRVRATLDAFDGDARIHSQEWDEEIPRELV